MLYDFVYGKKKKKTIVLWLSVIFVSGFCFGFFGYVFVFCFAFVLVVMMTAYLIKVCLGDKP